MAQPDIDGDALAAVIASEHRKHVLLALDDAAGTPAEVRDRIARDDGPIISNTSRPLRELREHGLIDLEVPEDTKKGRLYAITDAGERIADRVREVQGDD